MNKFCAHCGVLKPLALFHAHPSKRDGRDHRCKPCAKSARARLRQSRLSEFRKRELARWHARKPHPQTTNLEPSCSNS